MYVNAAYCYRSSRHHLSNVCLPVCDSSEPAKTAEPIKMLFKLWTRVGSRNYVLGGGPDPPWKGKGRPLYRNTLWWAVQKWLNWSWYRLGCALRWAQGMDSCIRQRSRSPMGRGNFEGEAVQKNGWTDQDAIWAEDLHGPKEPCIRLGPRSPMGTGNFKNQRGCLL